MIPLVTHSKLLHARNSDFTFFPVRNHLVAEEVLSDRDVEGTILPPDRIVFLLFPNLTIVEIEQVLAGRSEKKAARRPPI